MKQTPIIALSLSLLVSSSSFGVTAIFKDGLDLNGAPIPGMPPQPYSSTTTFPPGANTIVTDFVYSNGALADPSGYRALSVGNTYGGSAISRSVLDFDLTRLTSTLAPAPACFHYEITGLELIIEVSGNHAAPPLGFHLGNQAAGQPVLGTPMATQSGYNTSGSFVSVSLPTSSLGTTDVAALANDYVVTIASALEGNGQYVNLGSSIGPNTWTSDGAGSGYWTPGPELRIEYELVEQIKVPEPARALLLVLSTFGVLLRRGRRG